MTLREAVREARRDRTKAARLAYRLACRCATWEDSCRWLMDLGLARDRAEADALIYEGEWEAGLA